MLDKLQIGCICYDVKEKTDLHSVNDAGAKQWLHGHILYADAEIRIGYEQAPDMKVATLWYEALHGILNQAGQDDHSEEIIIALGYGIVRLIRDNPELVKLTVGEPETDKGNPF